MPADTPLRLIPGLRLRSWGESADALYVESSASSHLIDAAAGLILRALQANGGSDSAASLWQALAPDDSNADDLAMFQQHLQTLQNLGLLL